MSPIVFVLLQFGRLKISHNFSTSLLQALLFFNI